MIAPQTAGCLGDGALLGQTALDVLKVALALTGFTLGGVDAPVGRAVIEPGSRDIHVHPDLMVIAQVLVDVGGCSPVGMKKLFPTVFHETAENLETMIVSAGKIGYQVELAPHDLAALVRAKFADIIVE